MKDFLKKLHVKSSLGLVLFIDTLIVVFSFFIANYTAYIISIQNSILPLQKVIPVLIGVSLIAFYLSKSYKNVIRHTNTIDLLRVFVGFGLTGVLLAILTFTNGFFNISDDWDISYPVIFIYCSIVCLAGVMSRIFLKGTTTTTTTNTTTTTTRKDNLEKKQIMIYGAGHMGNIAYKILNAKNKIVGYLDDDPKKRGKYINQTRIYHIDEFEGLLEDKGYIEKIIIAVEKPSSLFINEVSIFFNQFQIPIMRIPPLSKWAETSFNEHQLKKINIEDLLGRLEIKTKNKKICSQIMGKTVMITGAAGSIGSEISRQVLACHPKKIILLDQAESALFDLQQELNDCKTRHQVAICCIVADVRNRATIFHLFKTHQPKKIFHAAAYKHVPLMEDNLFEAIRTNVGGTKNVIDASIAYKASDFVMISTDKAVNPTNMMGASKRLAEMYASCLSSETTTHFITTRFGNVLGSNGSVIPIFKKQIANGGPVTVTHKEITRYFMTIKEACNLVLEASIMGNSSEIYVFDMGEPIKIFDLAKKMIYLSGQQYPHEIDIKITGLRPGEKLYEELLADEEHTQKTHHPKIMIANTRDLPVDTLDKINVLVAENRIENEEESLGRLEALLVGEYKRVV